MAAASAATAAAARGAGFANPLRRHTECADAQGSKNILHSKSWRPDTPGAKTDASLLFDDTSFPFCATSCATLRSWPVLRASSRTSTGDSAHGDAYYCDPQSFRNAYEGVFNHPETCNLRLQPPTWFAEHGETGGFPLPFAHSCGTHDDAATRLSSGQHTDNLGSGGTKQGDCHFPIGFAVQHSTAHSYAGSESACGAECA